jgi:hypothetical protein
MRKLIPISLTLLLSGCLLGCRTTGHRKVTVVAFGQTFSWEDETLGEESWVFGFDDESALANLVVGSMFDKEKDKEEETRNDGD